MLGEYGIVGGLVHLRSEGDPWRKMGVNPRATAISLKEISNSTSKCKFCGEVYSIAEMINSYTCIDCYGENKNIEKKKCKSCLKLKTLESFFHL